jgi:hypothetical protein
MLKTRMVKGVSTCCAARLSRTKQRVPSGHRRPQKTEVCASRRQPAIFPHSSQSWVGFSVLFEDGVTRNDAFACQGDIVACGSLNEVHGLVSQAQNLSVGAAVGRKRCNAEAGGNLDVQIFRMEEDFRVQQVLEPPHDGEGILFRGLGQDHDEFIAPVSKRVINQAQVAFENIADSPKQPRSHKVAELIVHLFEVIEIKEDHRKLVTVPRGTVDFRVQNEIEVPSVKEGGTVIHDGEFMHALHVPRVFEGDRRVVCQALKSGNVLLRKTLLTKAVG